MADIDLSQVVWDDEPKQPTAAPAQPAATQPPQSPAGIDLSQVKWDDETSAPQTSMPPQPEVQQPGSVVERSARGFAEPFIGTAQMIGNTLANAPMRKTLEHVIPGAGLVMQGVDSMIGQRGFEDLKDRQNQLATESTQHQRHIAPEGVDWARLVGNLIGLMATNSVGGKGSSLPSMIARGAASGGVAGATAPVENADDTYFAKKAGDIALGAGTGAVAGPLVEKAAGAVGKGVAAAKGAVAPKMSPDDIKLHITQVLGDNGVDLSKLPTAYVDEISNQVRTAMQAGTDLDERSLVNMATAKTLGIDLTKGQATQNPMQYGDEMFLRQAHGGEQLADQYKDTLQKLNRNVDEVASGPDMVPPMLHVEAGQKAMTALKNADAPVKSNVDDLYKTAKNAVGVDFPLNGRKFVDRTWGDLEKNLNVSDVPADLTKAMNMISRGDGQLTVGRAEEMIQAINGRLSNLPVRDPQRVALNTVKKNLDAAIDETGGTLGGDAGAAFRKARAAAASRFRTIDQIPVLKKALDEDLAPDDFVKEGVYRAKVQDLRNLRGFLSSNDPEAWNQIRAQVLSDIKMAATRGSDDPADFSQAAFNRQLNALKSSGKFAVLFSPAEAGTLSAIGKVGRLVQQGPPGVSRTGQGGAAKALSMLTALIGHIPVAGKLGGVAQSAAQKGGNVLKSSAAMQAPPLAQLPSIISPEAAARTGALGAMLPALGSSQPASEEDSLRTGAQ